MLKRTAGVLFWLALLCGTCFGQTPLHGLVAGRSVRTDVERVAGKPVKVYSQRLVEYHPQEFDSKTWDKNVAKMYVQYRTDSPIVERIELLLGRPINRSDAFKLLEVSTAAVRQPHLPDQPTARGKNGDRLVEYFGAPFYVVLTYQGADTNSGVARTARYSKELFDSAARMVTEQSKPTAQPPATGAESARRRPAGEKPHTEESLTEAAYHGPSSGVINWSGKVEQDGLIAIEGLPGIPVMIDFDAKEYAVVESPSPSNKWKRLVLRSRRRKDTAISVRWTAIQ